MKNGSKNSISISSCLISILRKLDLIEYKLSS